jgi:hypothetical protein
MDRRGFLASLIGSLLLAWTRRPEARPVPQRLIVQESPLAGFQYHEGGRLWPRLRTGQPLALIREPGNHYDPHAVRIDWRGRKLGYLPRNENTAVSQMLDRGARLTARIERLRETRNPWGRVRVVVELAMREG